MNVVTFELRAANKDCSDSFTDIARVVFEGKPIFEHACEYANCSSSYKKSGRKLELLSVEEDCVRVRLYSEGKLEMPSKSLAGFSRELLRVDSELHPKEAKRLFKSFMYGSALFRNIELAESDIVNDLSEISDVEALKKCIDIFCSTMVSGKEANALLEDTKSAIKEVLKKYDTSSRMISYSKKAKEITKKSRFD